MEELLHGRSKLNTKFTVSCASFFPSKIDISAKCVKWNCTFRVSFARGAWYSAICSNDLILELIPLAQHVLHVDSLFLCTTEATRCSSYEHVSPTRWASKSGFLISTMLMCTLFSSQFLIKVERRASTFDPPYRQLHLVLQCEVKHNFLFTASFDFNSWNWSVCKFFLNEFVIAKSVKVICVFFFSIPFRIPVTDDPDTHTNWCTLTHEFTLFFWQLLLRELCRWLVKLNLRTDVETFHCWSFVMNVSDTTNVSFSQPKLFSAL